MALTNREYEEIQNRYKDIQIQNSELLISRQEEIFDKIPSYKELDDQISSLAFEQTKNYIFKKEYSVDVNAKIDAIVAQKKALLVQYGYKEDYLDPIFTCKDCLDTGYINNQKCHCFKKFESELLYKKSNLNILIQNNNFDLLSYDYYENDDLTHFKKAVDDCHKFIDNFSTSYENILFSGQVGTGKSFLSCCIAKDLLDKDYHVVYFSSTELFKLLSDILFDKDDRATLNSLRDVLYSSDLLIIDDLGTELYNSAISTQLFSVLNERHLHRKSTIISTNLTLKELQDRYEDRIFSRILERYSIKKITGPDIRRIKKINKI